MKSAETNRDSTSSPRLKPVPGATVVSRAVKRAIPARRRGIAFLLAVVLVAAVPAVCWLGWRIYAWRTPAHAESVGEPVLRANVRDLQNTDVVPTLDAWMSEGRNLIWCAAFQLAWNELCDLAGEDLRMVPEDQAVTWLNRKAFRKGQLDEETCFTGVGQTDGAGLEKMAESLNAKFQGKASPGLAVAGKSLPSGSVFAYAYLFASLPFEWAFDRHESPFDFNGSPVETFGIAQCQEKERLAAGQLLLYHTDERPGFVIELKTRRVNHHLYLAMIPPLATLGETARDVFKRVKEIKPRGLPDGSSLRVPMMDFDLTRDYVELIGRPLRARKFEGQPIAMATQQIRFTLNGRGAVLKSETLLAASGSAPDFAFTRPFLVLLQYEDSKMPYFAAWIDNAELLIRK